MRGLLKDFKTFLFQGNVIDLAVAIVLGIAFGTVVKALVTDLLTPIIALIFGKPDFGALSFTLNSSRFLYGDFINALIAFISVAAAIFFFVVKPVNTMAALRLLHRGSDAGRRAGGAGLALSGGAPSREPPRSPEAGPNTVRRPSAPNAGAERPSILFSRRREDHAGAHLSRSCSTRR